jgi:outer membrane lipoprotein SlyB
MRSIQRALGILTMSGALLTVGACNGTLGNVLGSVLGNGNGTQQQGQTAQINGTVRGLDTRSQQINIQDNSSGQTYWVQYDNRTQVVYRNQAYPAASIRQGDNVTARIQVVANNSYYTDYVQIN